ncbi:MAG: hypothetical protein FWF80_02345, partial [Defluviitaleaceae bacterium]|nr:hypothetical protein [Defluviitaleaceae bacterium]
GVLRRMYGDAIETIELYPPFLRPHIVRTSGDDLYVLTSPWQDGEEFFYGIIRITESGGEGFFLGDARNTDVRDFYVANGLIYFIERNEGTMRTHLRTICTQNPENIRTLSELSEGASALAISSCGERVYIADADTGVLVFFEGGELSNFAGAAGENAFIDGPAPLFYRPTRLKYHAGGLYVWDFNVLRRIDVQYGLAREVRTIAGAASPIYAMEFAESEAAEIFIFPHSVLADFVLANEFGDDGTILVSDSKRGVVWAVEFAS